MRQLRLALLAVATTMVAHVAWSATAIACSCAGFASPKEALAGATEVFSGRVTAILDNHVDGLAHATGPLVIRFEVERIWKGQVTPTFDVRTSMNGASCGYAFVTHGEYLVFAHEGRVSLCSSTKPLREASGDLDALGSGTAPATAHPAASAP